MPKGRRLDVATERQHLHLRIGDFDALGEMFPHLGPSAAARKLISNFVDKIRATQAPLDIDLSEVKIEELLS